MTRRRRRSRVSTLALCGGVLVALVALVGPVAAAGYDSTTEALIRGLNRRLLLVAVPVTLLVQGLLLYATVRFHFSDEPKPTRENRPLELAMVAAIAVVLVFVGASSYIVLAHPAVSDTPDEYAPPGDALRVDIIGQQWFWEVHYPARNVTVKNELVLPVGRTVILNVTSRDVIHSVHVPGLGLKQDAIPGQRNVIRTTPTHTGRYRLYCAEYCGAGHSKMLGTVRVVSPETYRQWLDEHAANASTATATAENTEPAATNGTATAAAATESATATATAA